MNKVHLIGRLVRDPEIKITQSQTAVCSFTVAVDRRYKGSGGERQADFISCIAWRQQAEFLGKFFKKGSRICIIGSLQTRTYEDKDEKTIKATEVSVEELEFVDSKKDSGYTDINAGIPSASAESTKKYLPPEIDNGYYPGIEDNGIFDL